MSNFIYRGLVSSTSKIILWVSMLLITGCATSFKPHTVLCDDIQNAAVRDTNKREELNGFSVLPPSGDNWCASKPGPNGVIFYTNRYIGQHTTQPLSYEVLALQSFIVMANTLEAKDVDISSSTAINEFVKRWHHVGAAAQTDDLGGWHVEFGAQMESSRFKLISLETMVDDTFNADCVRYKAITEERNSPRVPDWVFISNNIAVVCRHPRSDSHLIHVMYSERRRDSYENDELHNKISAEAEHTIRSLEFDVNVLELR